MTPFVVDRGEILRRVGFGHGRRRRLTGPGTAQGSIRPCHNGQASACRTSPKVERKTEEGGSSAGPRRLEGGRRRLTIIIICMCKFLLATRQKTLPSKAKFVSAWEERNENATHDTSPGASGKCVRSFVGWQSFFQKSCRGLKPHAVERTKILHSNLGVEVGRGARWFRFAPGPTDFAICATQR
jgi:hypothetical protein